MNLLVLPLLLLNTIAQPAQPTGAPAVAREFRAAWVTPVEGFDWPNPSQSATRQKAELVKLLDQASAAHLNAIILHVRVSGDALYKTKRAPWSAYLTGKQGKSPGYDPLAFAIHEAHARGLQLHAWFNPFRATPSPAHTRPAASDVVRRHPGWIVHYGSETWINPGIPAARASVLATILEVVDNYDIDGVHLDDYFYPYREDGAGDFNDPISFRKYGKAAGFKSKADWRRNNIDKFVKALYAGVHDRKPWVVVGISPFGIWKSGVPDGVTGLDAYSEIYADSRLWLREGWLDYIAPQLYWPMNGAQERFSRLLAWWQTENPKERYIWPGLAAFIAHQPSWRSDELAREIDAIRDAQGDRAGHVHFHLRSALTRGPFYDDVALVPPMTWLAKSPPAAPVLVKRVVGADSIALHLAAMKPQVRWLVVQTRSAGKWHSAVRFAARKLNVPKAERIVVTPLSRTGALGKPLVIDAT